MPSLEDRRRMSVPLIRAAEKTKHAFALAVDQSGLNATQARVILSLFEPRRMSDLATEVACDGSHITAIADKLSTMGLVIRVEGDDRRVKLLTLTEKGRTTRQELGRLIAEQPYPADRLSARERRTLEKLLLKLLGDD